MFFFNGLHNFTEQSALNLMNVWISDDSQLQAKSNNYFYNVIPSLVTNVTTYPHLDIIRTNSNNSNIKYLSTFNIPSENYTYLNNYANSKGIYKLFWETYLNERYNVQNKKITCYINLTETDYNNFQWNKLIKIDNQICIPNKIFDYNIGKRIPTKMEFITVQNPNAYSDSSFIDELDELVITQQYDQYINGQQSNNETTMAKISSISNVIFDPQYHTTTNNGKTYVINGLEFNIINKIDSLELTYKKIQKYVGKEDINITLHLKNDNYTTEISCVRYSVYPYPEIKLYESDGTTERSTIYPGSRSYKLAWYGTETDGLENKPTVTIENHGTGSATINANTWVENQVMIAEGDDEWFRTEYVVDFNTNMTNYPDTYIKVTMVDKEGWYDEKTFNITI
jgi:hypothetical protein